MFEAIKQIRIFAGLLATGLLFTGVLSAQEPTVSMDQLMRELVGNNPQIQAAENKYQAALAMPGPARTLPDPVVSFVSKNASGNPVPFTTLGEDPLSSVGVMWEQELPYPGKLKLAGKIAEKEAAAVGAEAGAVRWRIIAQFKQAYYKYFQVNRSLEILQESLDFLKRIEQIAEARYSVGEGIQQDVFRAQLEISILAQRITRMEQEKDSAAAEINQLLNRQVDSPLSKPAEITISEFSESLENLQQTHSLKSPMILSGEAMLQREQLSVDLAKKQYRPDFMSSLEYDNSPNFPDMWEIQIGVRIPIFYKKKQAYGVVEASRNLNRAEKELAAARQEVAFNIRNEYLQIQTSQKLLKLYRDAVIPQSNLALESGIVGYQAGKADFLTTLSSFLALLEYRMSYFEELARHESALARLEQAIGRSVTGDVLAGGQENE